MFGGSLWETGLVLAVEMGLFSSAVVSVLHERKGNEELEGARLAFESASVATRSARAGVIYLLLKVVCGTVTGKHNQK